MTALSSRQMSTNGLKFQNILFSHSGPGAGNSDQNRAPQTKLPHLYYSGSIILLASSLSHDSLRGQ